MVCAIRFLLDNQLLFLLIQLLNQYILHVHIHISKLVMVFPNIYLLKFPNLLHFQGIFQIFQFLLYLDTNLFCYYLQLIHLLVLSLQQTNFPLDNIKVVCHISNSVDMNVNVFLLQIIFHVLLTTCKYLHCNLLQIFLPMVQLLVRIFQIYLLNLQMLFHFVLQLNYHLHHKLVLYVQFLYHLLLLHNLHVLLQMLFHLLLQMALIVHILFLIILFL